MPKLPEAKSTTGSVVNPPVKPKKKLVNFGYRWLLVVLVVLAVFEVLITSNQATNGSQMADLQVEHDQLTEDIAKLDRQVSQISSLTYIRQYATDKLGMVAVDKNVLYQTDAPAKP